VVEIDGGYNSYLYDWWIFGEKNHVFWLIFGEKNNVFWLRFVQKTSIY